MKLVVGLGNPGRRYAENRHNVGYQCVERVAQQHGLTFGRVMFKSYVVSGTVAATKVVLARPLTFMNLSGQAVRPLLRWHRVELPDLLVIYDDLDLPLGKIRLRPKGGSGGHRGMRSIIKALGTGDFPRLRIGIGRPVRGEPEDYVLSDFTTAERVVMEDTYEHAVAAVVSFLTQGIARAMDKVNASPGSTG